MKEKQLFLKRAKRQLLMNMNTDAAAIIMKPTTLKNPAAVVIIMVQNIAAASMRVTMKNTTAAVTIMKKSMKSAVMTTVRKATNTAVNMVTLMKKDIIMTTITAAAVMITSMSKTAWTPIGMFQEFILLSIACSFLPWAPLPELKMSV